VTKDKIFYRGDKELYKKAKVKAIIQGKPVYQFINEAIKEKLEKKP